MVILVFKGPASSRLRGQTVLRQILKSADYETRGLASGRSVEAAKLVRLIRAATIDPGNYPQSRRSRAREQRASVESWENEGGSTLGEA